MVLNRCKNCNYETSRASNLKRHLSRKNPCSESGKKSHEVAQKSQNVARLGQNVAQKSQNVARSGQKTSQKNKNGRLFGPPVDSSSSYTDIQIFECEECEKTLSSLKSLRRHEKTCDGPDTNDCPTCGKEFKSKSGKYKHVKKNRCKKLNNDKEIKILKEKLKKMENDIKENSTTTINNNTVINNVMQNNTQNTQNIQNNSIENISNTMIKDIFDQHYTRDYFLRAEIGLADFAIEYILKDGEIIYLCTDRARRKFSFVDKDGNMKEDPNADKLFRKISSCRKNVIEFYNQESFVLGERMEKNVGDKLCMNFLMQSKLKLNLIKKNLLDIVAEGEQCRIRLSRRLPGTLPMSLQDKEEENEPNSKLDGAEFL